MCDAENVASLLEMALLETRAPEAEAIEELIADDKLLDKATELDCKFEMEAEALDSEITTELDAIPGD